MKISLRFKVLWTLSLNLACLLSFLAYSEAQTPAQHRKILDSVDLSDRDSKLGLRIIWDQNNLIPNCRENYAETMPGRTCDRRTFQYIDGPSKVPRNEKEYKTPIDFLPNTLANSLAFSTGVGGNYTVHERCTEKEIQALAEWAKANQKLQRDDVLTVSYLSPNDPWAFCFHEDSWAWDTDLRQGIERVFQNQVFWIWRGGEVVGTASCSIARRSPGGGRNYKSKIFPQCSIELNFGQGDYQMRISPFPAANLRVMLSRLGPMTRDFWMRFEETIALHDFDKDLFFPKVHFSDRTQNILKQIEEQVR
ncbi:hypothetical protein GCM10007094_44730 [Pseudovibrio japonicus]|uniref:Uncharacterized protein n=1 Tax=Pseudovibrio japonicus TaxID=366534 RepID=A0ABQ3ERV7_9HYPH|nr:hypothetical protein [Pseudovibrio japonicus]GHB50676.1 hypothetical protein GCM10007094_44730 [Pseudovibrio japonicus]